MAMEQTQNGPMEGRTTQMMEQQTSRLPSNTFLWLAGGSIVASFVLQLRGYKDESQFVGQWAPTFLILGVYNKIVKLLGSD